MNNKQIYIMKKVTLFLFTVLMLVSCASVKPTVGLYLSDVNGNQASGMSYIDDMIAIDWSYIYKARLNFKLKNNTKSTIRIMWDDAAYVNASGSTDRVMHAGVKYINRNESQPPSSVPAGAYIEDAVIPTSVIAFMPYVGWTEGNLFTVSVDSREAKKQLENTYGKTVKVLLPIESNGIITDYEFSFTVTSLKR